MMSINKKSAYGGHRSADFKANNHFHFNQSSKKMKPAYFSELQYYPKANPVLISTNWDCLNFIRNHHGVCFLCNKNSEFYDLSFCKNKDVWVLYCGATNEALAMKLGHTILRHQATEVRIIPFNEELLNKEEL